MNEPRLTRQLEFILEVEKLKQIFRQTVLPGDGRRENDAEHSWHLSLMAVLLVEHAGEEVDLLKVVEMLLIHDLVEIDAGDTFAYDVEGNADKEERERRAAERIFHLLPADQAAKVRDLWEEFEARQTPEARYAAALDRLQPLMLNFRTEGLAWRRHGVTREQVIARNRHIEEGSPLLWKYAEGIRPSGEGHSCRYRHHRTDRRRTRPLRRPPVPGHSWRVFAGSDQQGIQKSVFDGEYPP